MKLKVLTFAFFFSLFITITPQKTLAHEEAKDGNMTVVLHVEPNDNPIAQKLSNLDFEFADKQEKFKPQDCNCRLTIFLGDNKLLETNLKKTAEIEPSIFGLTTSYIFPAAGSYQIALSASPNKNNSFKNFDVSWTTQVSAQQIKPRTEFSYTKTILTYFAFAAVLSLFIFLLILKVI
ncbi:MAG TPA: hypothetical protein VG965_05250 [Patescibacteria group bacterium]|nr:hypothetical protein [Patescibacteria group bacterium]